jgi:hypothetical protein
MSAISILMFVPILFRILLLISFSIMFVYGFILLVKFLRVGTKACNIYIEKNIGSNSQGLGDTTKDLS